MNRLIVVEGLPGMGKSSTSAYIAKLLEHSGENVAFVDEGTNHHPADYEFHAFLSNRDILELPRKVKARVNQYGERLTNGYIFPLALSEDDFEVLLPYKIYDFLPWQVEQKIMLDGWKKFAATADKDTTYVFNCCMLQNPMCETMMRFNLPMEESEHHIQQIVESVKSMNPLVIYLECGEVKSHLRQVALDRDEGWRDAVVRYHEQGAFGQEQGFSGLEGYLDCLVERQARELTILESLDVDLYVLKDPFKNWTRAYSRIESFMGIE